MIDYDKPDMWNMFFLHPGILTAGTQKSPNWKGKSFEPNLHFWGSRLVFQGVFEGGFLVWWNWMFDIWNQKAAKGEGRNFEVYGLCNLT